MRATGHDLKIRRAPLKNLEGQDASRPPCPPWNVASLTPIHVMFQRPAIVSAWSLEAGFVGRGGGWYSGTIGCGPAKEAFICALRSGRGKLRDLGVP